MYICPPICHHVWDNAFIVFEYSVDVVRTFEQNVPDWAHCSAADGMSMGTVKGFCLPWTGSRRVTFASASERRLARISEAMFAF